MPDTLTQPLIMPGDAGQPPITITPPLANPSATPNDDIQAMYTELNSRGVFKSNPDLAAMGHELRARGVVNDPTQGGLATTQQPKAANPLSPSFDTSTPQGKLQYANAQTPAQRGGLSPEDFVTAWGLGQTPLQYAQRVNANAATQDRPSQYNIQQGLTTVSKTGTPQLAPESDPRITYANNLTTAQRGGLSPVDYVKSWAIGQKPPQYLQDENGAVSTPTGSRNAPVGQPINQGRGGQTISIGRNVINTVKGIPAASSEYNSELLAGQPKPNDAAFQSAPVTQGESIPAKIVGSLPAIPNMAVGLGQQLYGAVGNALRDEFSNDTPAQAAARAKTFATNLNASLPHMALPLAVNAAYQSVTGHGMAKGGAVDELLKYGADNPIGFGADVATTGEMIKGAVHPVIDAANRAIGAAGEQGLANIQAPDTHLPLTTELNGGGDVNSLVKGNQASAADRRTSAQMFQPSAKPMRPTEPAQVAGAIADVRGVQSNGEAPHITTKAPSTTNAGASPLSVSAENAPTPQAPENAETRPALPELTNTSGASDDHVGESMAAGTPSATAAFFRELANSHENPIAANYYNEAADYLDAHHGGGSYDGSILGKHAETPTQAPENAASIPTGAIKDAQSMSQALQTHFGLDATQADAQGHVWDALANTANERYPEVYPTKQSFYDQHIAEINNGIKPSVSAENAPTGKEPILAQGKDQGTLFQKNPQTDSPEFKQFFDGSKVVDEQGNPKVVYHGAPDTRFVNGNGTFQTLKERLGMVDKDSDRAFFFTDSEGKASTYADPRRAFDSQEADPGVVPAYLNLKNPLEINAHGQNWRKFQGEGWTGTRGAVEAAKAAGHDGIIVRNVVDDYNTSKSSKPATVYAVFNPEQVKSATDNRGTFDPADPNILHQQAKGQVSFRPEDGKAIISALHNPDASTSLHELGHVLVKTLRGDDLAAVEKWNGGKLGDWTRGQHEKFARAWERYFHDGVAPNAGLAKAFETIKTALRAIYHNLAGSPIKDAVAPELKAVFDRVLGKDADHVPPKFEGNKELNPDGTPKYAGSINLNRINVSEEGKQKLIEDAEKHIASHVGYPESVNPEIIRKGADALGLTPDKIASWPNGDIPSDLGNRALVLKAIRDQVKQTTDRIMQTSANGDAAGLAKAESDLKKITPVLQRHAREWGQTGFMLGMEADPFSEALGRAQEKQAAFATTTRLSTKRSATVSNDAYLRAKAILNQSDTLNQSKEPDTLYQMSDSKANAATQVGVYHYENGAKTPAKWEAAMKQDAPTLDAEDLARVRSNVLDQIASKQAPEARAKVNSFADDMARTMGTQGSKDFINELTVDHPGILNKIIAGQKLNPVEEGHVTDIGHKYQTDEVKAARTPSMSGTNTVRQLIKATGQTLRGGNTLDAALKARRIDTVRLAERAESEPTLKSGIDKLRSGGTLTDPEMRAVGNAIDDLRPARVPGIQKPISAQLTAINRQLKNGEIGFEDAKSIVAHLLSERIDDPDKLTKALADVANAKDDGLHHDLANKYNKWITPNWNTLEGAGTKAKYAIRSWLLSGPGTLKSIVVSHLLGQGVGEEAVNAALAAMSKGKYADANLGDTAKAVGKFFKSAPESGRILRYGTTSQELRGIAPYYRQSDLPHKQLGTEPVSGVTRIPPRSHAAVFHMFGQASEEAARARYARLWTNRGLGTFAENYNKPSVIAAAKKSALESIYMNPNKLASALDYLESKGGVIGKVIGATEAPFRRVPLNIAGRGLEYAGGGLISAPARYLSEGKSRAQMSPDDLFLYKQGIAKTATRGAVGLAAGAGLGAFLTSRGILNPPNEKNYELGSINYNGNRYDINRFAPFVTPIEEGGELYLYIRGADSDFIAPFSDSPFSTATNQMKEYFKYKDEKGKNADQNKATDRAKMVGSILSTYIPTLSSQFASTTDPSGMIRVKKGVLDASINKVPWARETLGVGKYPQSSNFKSTGVIPTLVYPGTVEKGPTEHKSSSGGVKLHG